MSDDPIRSSLEAAARGAAGVTKIAQGNPIGGVADLLDAALILVPVDDLRKHLTDAARRRQDALAAAVVAARFPKD